MLRGYFCFFGILALAGSAHATCENGMTETLIVPAAIEHGDITYQMFRRPAVYREIRMPVGSQTMTKAEYDALPKPSVYMHHVSVPEKMKTTPIELALGDLAEFDYVYWPDGTVATRKIKEPFPRIVNNEEILEPVTTEYIETEFERPEPLLLRDGRLQVVISPAYQIPVAVPGITHEVTRKYVKSRTPAKYQLTFCETENQPE